MFITDQNQELAELTTNPPAGITVELADEKDIYVWKAVMEGPAGSPYAVSLCPRTHALETQTLLQDFATLFCSIAVVLSNLLHISMALHHTILPTAYATEHLMLSISEAANH
jgi:hypothetical protein